MTGWSYDPMRADLAAYALDALEPADHLAVQAHLETCEDCRAELAEFVAVVPRLAAVADSELTLPQPSPDLFDRVAAAVDASAAPGTAGGATAAGDGARRTRPAARARRRTRWLTAAAAVLVLVLSGAAVLTAQRLQHPDSISAAATSGPISMHVTAVSAASGTTLRVRVDGAPQNIRCHLVVTQDDGSRSMAGSWSSNYSGHAVFTSSTDVPRDRVATLTLYDAANRDLISLHM